MERRGDAEIMQRVRQGDRAAMTELYERLAPRALATATKILGCRAEAEDVVNDVFMEAWARAADWDATRGSVTTWVLLRTRSRSIDRLRRIAAMRKHTERVHQDDTTSPHVLDVRRDVLDRAIARLSSRDRRLLSLRIVDGRTFDDVAAQLGIPRSTAVSALDTALAKMRASIAA